MIRINFTLSRRNGPRISLYSIPAMLIASLQFPLAYTMGRYEQSAHQWRMANGPNMTSDFYGNTPYDDFRCTPIRTEDCASSHELKVARILPLVLFVTEILVLREVFSISGTYKSFLVYGLWIISFYILINISLVVIRKPFGYEVVGLCLSVITFATSFVIIQIAASYNIDIDPSFFRSEYRR